MQIPRPSNVGADARDVKKEILYTILFFQASRNKNQELRRYEFQTVECHHGHSGCTKTAFRLIAIWSYPDEFEWTMK